jgi:hypothetical protein
MDLRTRIRDDIIPIYDRFLQQSLVPVIVFSFDQLVIINAFLDLYHKKHISSPEIDMMLQFNMFENMKQYIA